MNNRLKIIRAERDLTQEQLAVLCGVSRATINGIEKRGVIPKGDTMLLLSRALHVPVQDIFFDFNVV